jgi:hypothetical protein
MISPARDVFRRFAVASVALTLILALVGHISTMSMTYPMMATMALFLVFALLQGIFPGQVQPTVEISKGGTVKQF